MSCTLAQTRRTRTAGKVEIPSVDDHVSKLEHMGRETVKKLANLKEAAQQAGLDDLKLPESLVAGGCIESVGMFQQLALVADQVRSSLPSLSSRTGTARVRVSVWSMYAASVPWWQMHDSQMLVCRMRTCKSACNKFSS